MKPVLEEHFDKCTSGTQEEPSGNYSYTADFLFNDPGWTVGGVGSAGGCIFINEYANVSYPGKGFLSTPKMNLQTSGGRSTMTFRARLNKLPEEDYDAYPQVETNPWILNILYRTTTGITKTSYTLSDKYQDFSMEVENGDLSSNFTFYGHNVLIDDVVILKEERSIEPPLNPRYTDLTVNGFTANWDAVEGAVAYRINVFSLDDEGNRVYAPKLQNSKVFGGTTTSKAISLDMHTVYYFNVKAVSPTDADGNEGENSAESQTVMVLGLFDTPVPKIPEDATAEGFTAEWIGVPNTTGYNLESFIFHSAQSCEEYYLVNDDFSAAVPEFISAGFLDKQMNRSQWFTFFTLNQTPGILTLNNSQSKLAPGSLISPVYDLPDGASLTIMFDYKGDDISKAGVSVGNGRYYPVYEMRVTEKETVVPTDEWQHFKKTFRMESGESTQIVIQCEEGSGSLDIDNLAVSVSLEEGQCVTVPYKTKEVEGESYFVETGDAIAGDILAFRVTGFAIDQKNYYLYTPTSDLMGVPFTDYPPASENSVNTVLNGETPTDLTINGNTVMSADVFSVYNANGMVIFRGSGYCTLSRGLYLICSGSKTYKIIIP